MEYAYGGDPNNSGTGVFQSAPLSVANATYYQSYLIGTVKDINKVYETLNEVKAEFIANEYSLIHKNCNHFADQFCQRLLGKALPSYINRLARMGTWVSFLLP